MESTGNREREKERGRKGRRRKKGERWWSEGEEREVEAKRMHRRE